MLDSASKTSDRTRRPGTHEPKRAERFHPATRPKRMRIRLPAGPLACAGVCECTGSPCFGRPGQPEPSRRPRCSSAAQPVWTQASPGRTSRLLTSCRASRRPARRRTRSQRARLGNRGRLGNGRTRLGCRNRRRLGLRTRRGLRHRGRGTRHGLRLGNRREFGCHPSIVPPARMLETRGATSAAWRSTSTPSC
jgi:hypothetical protein